MMRTWWDTEAIVGQFRDWLTQTGDELASFDASADDDISDVRDAPAEPMPEIGLLELAEAVTAMRHELKLGTKSTRGLEESLASALAGLDAARRQFQSAQSREQESAERAALPLVEALVGLDEALQRGEAAFAAMHRQMTHTASHQLRAALDEKFARLSRRRRRRARRWHKQVKRMLDESSARPSAQEFTRLMEGFGLIRARGERMLRDHDIRRIDCVGQPVDPARMTVVELVDDPAAPPETVVEEVRPGYTWRDRVVRFAEVRAVSGGAVQEMEPTL